MIDHGEKKYKEYTGNIVWISDKAESSLQNNSNKRRKGKSGCHAMKVKVKNDGFLKIGMYGEAELACALGGEI